ncbi:MAG TPA: hydrogenase [Treponema sp.]|nr:MAG: hypothetical protein A2001_11535 [Treponema sp. GWC1_61_84]HCM26957.1 hydrogenase [Treponema sp.]
MDSMVLILSASGIFFLSGFPALLLRRHPAAGRRIATVAMICGSALGLAGVAAAIVSALTPSFDAAWSLPWGGFSVRADPLALVFLLPVFILPTLASIYGLGYAGQGTKDEDGPRLGLSFGILAAGMTVTAVARDGALFLLSWEIMAIAAFFAGSIDEDDAEARRAGWIYLVATHAGTLCLIAMFALWNRATGSFALVPNAAVDSGTAGTLFVLALVGFGFKAGLMPLHVWLPGFYAHAPSQVAAVLSPVMSKMGVYGLFLVTVMLPSGEAWWGEAALAVGAITAVGGIAFAAAQSDAKRLLAYSSVENVGIIVMGFGLALLGRVSGRGAWIALGAGGALFHVWNHGLFKSLLFMAAGSAERAAGSRDMDKLGGLAARMPKTAFLFTVGALAICGLPPLNGFASELPIYIGLFSTLGLDGRPAHPGAAVAVAALAMAGALAVAAFVKALSAIFLGNTRGAALSPARDPSAAMLGPMVLTAVACAALGSAPLLVVPLLDRVVAFWAASAGLPSLGAAAPYRALGIAGPALAAAVGLLALIAIARKPAGIGRRGSAVRIGTWDCGYARPTARMQYSSSSFARSIVTLFKYLLYPKKLNPDVVGAFPVVSRHDDEVPDTIHERIVLPFVAFIERSLPRMRWLQQGQTHHYILYMLVILFVLLAVGGIL